MDREAAERFVAAVEDARDIEFRAVIYYWTTPTGVEYETLRFRADIRDRYDEAERATLSQNIVDDLALEELSSEWHERLHGVGPLRFTTRVFEEATVIHAGRDGRGLYLSVDNEDVPTLDLVRRKLRAFC